MCWGECLIHLVIQPSPWCTATCIRYFDTKLHGILPWADINRNCNTFLVKEYQTWHSFPESVKNFTYLCQDDLWSKTVWHIWMASGLGLFHGIQTEMNAFDIMYRYVSTWCQVTVHHGGIIRFWKRPILTLWVTGSKFWALSLHDRQA